MDRDIQVGVAEYFVSKLVIHGGSKILLRGQCEELSCASCCAEGCALLDSQTRAGNGPGQGGRGGLLLGTLCSRQQCV